MINQHKHIFLVPLRELNDDFAMKIIELSKFDVARFTFVVSVQNQDAFDNYEGVFHDNHIIIIKPDKFYEREKHWEYVITYVNDSLNFDSFSYFFSNDDMNLEYFPEVGFEMDVYINDYFLNDWCNVKETMAHLLFANMMTPEVMLRTNLLVGKPMFAPLQKIIFSKAMAEKVKFQSDNAFVCDQMMVYSLLQSNAKICIVKSPFYLINGSNRNYANAISLIDVLKQQIHLYWIMKCYIGIPMIVIRTLLKYLFLKHY